jgi:hypothetical protein
MNFNHFTETETALTPEALPELLHDLLRQSAALQLKFNQTDFDLLIPTYFGKEGDKFKPSLVSGVFVQVKNRKGKSHLNFSPGMPLFAKLRQPVLGILLDLRRPSDTPTVFYPAFVGHGPPCFGLNLNGHLEGTYGVLQNDERLRLACRDLLLEINNTPGALDLDIRETHMRFRTHTREERYPGIVDLEPEELEGSDEDTENEDQIEVEEGGGETREGTGTGKA